MSEQEWLRVSLAGLAASGRLGPAFALLAETQAALAPEAAAALHTAESAAGALLEAEPVAALSLDALSATLARLGPQDGADPEALNPLEQELSFLPPPLRAEAGLAARAGARWRFVAPGMRSLALPLEAGLTAELLRIEPGHGAPEHGHDGEEFTLVVQGAYHDGHRRYGPGELSAAGRTLVHRPIAEAGPLCYALAISAGGARLTGVLGALRRLMPH